MVGNVHEFEKSRLEIDKNSTIRCPSTAYNFLETYFLLIAFLSASMSNSVYFQSIFLQILTCVAVLRCVW